MFCNNQLPCPVGRRNQPAQLPLTATTSHHQVPREALPQWLQQFKSWCFLPVGGDFQRVCRDRSRFRPLVVQACA